MWEKSTPEAEGLQNAHREHNVYWYSGGVRSLVNIGPVHDCPTHNNNNNNNNNDKT